jgi:hypothetical protein
MLQQVSLHNIGAMSLNAGSFAPRLNLVAGYSGTGKSFLLDVLWWTLSRQWPQEVNHNLLSGYPAQPGDRKLPARISFTLQTEKSVSLESYIGKWSTKEQSWVGPAGRPLNDGIVVYARSDGSFAIWDPLRNAWQKKGSKDVQERQAYVFTPTELLNGLVRKVSPYPTPVHVCNGLLRDWVSWILQDTDEAKQMLALLPLFAPESFTAPVQVGPRMRMSIQDIRDIPSIILKNPVPLLCASASIRRAAELAYMLVWAQSEHAYAATAFGVPPVKNLVFLWDEPEAHLSHVGCFKVLDNLHRVINVLGVNCQSFLATSDVANIATYKLLCTEEEKADWAHSGLCFDPKQDAFWKLRDGGIDLVAAK